MFSKRTHIVLQICPNDPFFLTCIIKNIIIHLYDIILPYYLYTVIIFFFHCKPLKILDVSLDIVFFVFPSIYIHSYDRSFSSYIRFSLILYQHAAIFLCNYHLSFTFFFCRLSSCELSTTFLLLFLLKLTPRWFFMNNFKKRKS